VEGLVMKSLAVVALLAVGSPALADSPTDGVGRISIGGGLRWTPNWYFDDRASAQGRATTGAEEPVTAPFGPQGLVSFGYGAFEWFEVAIDLFVGYESFQLQGWLPFTSVSYGALIGVRATRYDFPLPGLVPYVGVQTGPMLVTVTSPSVPQSEALMQAFSVNGGAAYKITDRLGLFVDVRWILGRVFVADIAGRNVGGIFASAGLTIFFPPSPKRDQDLPGFGPAPRF
jgi:hypothetical protein